MIGFISNNAGVLGLVIFFSIFSIVVIWLFNPNFKKKIESHKFIPIKNKKVIYVRKK